MMVSVVLLLEELLLVVVTAGVSIVCRRFLCCFRFGIRVVLLSLLGPSL